MRLVYIDESGDHSLRSIDREFPVFALSAVVIDRERYLNEVIPAICDLKMRIWGHEGIVLHSSEIRRCEGPFAKLQLP